MATFTDAKQREWELLIDARRIMRVREECDPLFLLNDTREENTYTRLESDPALLCRVLFVLCVDQRRERDIDEESFYLGVIGDAIDDATNAMLAAIKSFIPRRQRELLEASSQMRDRIQRHGTERLLQQIADPGLEAEIKEKIDREIEQGLSRLRSMPPSSASSTQGSSASHPNGSN